MILAVFWANHNENALFSVIFGADHGENIVTNRLVWERNDFRYLLSRSQWKLCDFSYFPNWSQWKRSDFSYASNRSLKTQWFQLLFEQITVKTQVLLVNFWVEHSKNAVVLAMLLSRSLWKRRDFNYLLSRSLWTHIDSSFFFELITVKTQWFRLLLSRPLMKTQWF